MCVCGCGVGGGGGMEFKSSINLYLKDVSPLHLRGLREKSFIINCFYGEEVVGNT